MLITKKESKQLRYFARANYKADVKGTTAEDGSKVKYREFPVYGLCYNEKKADNGMVELTDIQVLYKPFTGTTFAELMEALNAVLGSEEVGEKVEEPISKEVQATLDCLEANINGTCTQEPIPPGPPIVQRLKKSETGKQLKTMAEAVSGLAHPEVQVVKSEIKDLSPDGTLTIDVQGVIPQVADHVNVQIDVNKQKSEHESVSDPLGELTGTVNPTWSSGNENVEPLNDVHAKLAVEQIHKDFEKVVESDEQPAENVDAAESVKFVEEHNAPVLEVKNVPDQEIPVVEDVTEAKRVTEETGTPVVTAEQKPKKLSRAELYNLQMKCGVMRLATLYGESPDTGLDVLMKLYPDAASRLNEVYAADGIKTYTITEEAIKKAYPDEYAALRK